MSSASAASASPVRRLRGRALLLLLLLPIPPATSAADAGALTFAAELGTGFDSNVGNAERNRDVHGSGFVHGAGHASHQRFLSETTTLLARGTAQVEHYERYDGLSNLKAGGLARLLYRADGGFTTPVFSAFVSAALWDFQSAIRDSTEYRAGVAASQQLTTRLGGRLGLGVSHRDSDSRVFDLNGWSAQLQLDWRAAPRAMVYLGHQFYLGDIVSSATTPPPFKAIQEAEVIEPDDAFGGFAGGANAYRLDGSAHVGTLGMNYALSARWALDSQVQYLDTRADRGNEYRRFVGVLSLLSRF